MNNEQGRTGSGHIFPGFGFKEDGMLDLRLYDERKKDLNYTFANLSEYSEVPINTLTAIFSGRNPNPRIDTIEAIEKALGIDTITIIAPDADDVLPPLNPHSDEFWEKYGELLRDKYFQAIMDQFVKRPGQKK